MHSATSILFPNSPDMPPVAFAGNSHIVSPACENQFQFFYLYFNLPWIAKKVLGQV